MRRQTKEQLKTILQHFNMTKREREQALVSEQISKFKAKGGKIKYLKADKNNLHDFLSVPSDYMAVSDFLTDS